MEEKLIVANCSGFFGDRLSAARELVEGGPIDVLTGDYLAELTMALLFRMKLKDPDKGYASTFLAQMEQIMGTCLDKGIKIVSNAGGLNPKGLAKGLSELAKILGLDPKIAYIEGDDLMPRLSDLQEAGQAFSHLDKDTPLKDSGLAPLTANAYLGGQGITKALQMGADIVVGGRIADAALVSGPAAWKFDWQKDDYDALAGAYAAGHIIECGTQATGGNYSFMDEIPSYKNMGFPIAQIFANGDFIITKHEGTGGLVSKGTVTAQLMYEIRQPYYLTPDVTVRFDTLDMEQIATDRVKVTNVKGEPPNGKTKVCINTLFGFKNSMTVVLTGLDIEEKAKIVEEVVFDLVGGKDQFDRVDVSLVKSGHPDPVLNDEAFSYLRISVMDKDQKKVGKRFSAAIVEAALSSIPGFTLTAPPSREMPAILHWPCLITLDQIKQQVVMDGEMIDLAFDNSDNKEPCFTNAKKDDAPGTGIPVDGPKKEIPFGRLFATRSGDKGGNANLGVWAKTREGFDYLDRFLTIEQLKELLPDMAEFEIERYRLPNLYAINFYIKGVLEDGVAASLRSDPQAKTLGEYLRAKVIMVPENLVS
ncbi:MAG: DUF1446 domain-containing protein [Desulfobacteraceae bacterium]|nr:DUF1446 domain-containing protein [Desulfobacteraceae bacterium]